jgi:hypothetical protein
VCFRSQEDCGPIRGWRSLNPGSEPKYGLSTRFFMLSRYRCVPGGLTPDLLMLFR